VKILVYDGGQQEDEEVEGRAKSRDHHYHERRRASPLFLVSFMLGSLVACVFVTFFLGGRDILHHALVAATNRLARQTEAPAFPNLLQQDGGAPLPLCQDALHDVSLLPEVLTSSDWTDVRDQLRAATGYFTDATAAGVGTSSGHGSNVIEYSTAGRRSGVLTSTSVAAFAPALARLHHDATWIDRLSRAAGRPLFPLDEKRFPMAFAAHIYKVSQYTETDHYHH
jgi:hypothetical protein